MTDASLRPYNPVIDADELWELKTDFELSLGTAPKKMASYEAKLDENYREGYLTWVESCIDEEPCVQVADAADGLVGYLFLLPSSLGYIWDAAVVNELFVTPDYRGTGLADDMMGWALEYAKGQSPPLDRILLDVDRENPRARAFYDRHGFSHWGEMVVREL